MLTEKDYCDYETCVVLSELGCPVPKYAIINIHTKEKEWKMWLSLYDALKWLREEKKIEVLVLSKGMVGAPYDVQVYTEDYVIQEGIEYSTYEDGLLEGIKEAVKILKEELNEET